MAFLNARCLIRWRLQANFYNRLQLSALGACEGYGMNTSSSGCLNPSDHISRVPTGGNADCHITSLSQGLNLARKNDVVSVIVANRRHAGGVDREGKCRKGATLKSEASDKLCRDVLGISRTAPISKDQNLVSLLERAHKDTAGFSSLRQEFLVL